MSFAFRLGMALVAGMVFFAAGQADARLVNYEGECKPDGGNWTVVITINDATGKVTRREGINCSGVHWVDHCTVVTGGLGATSDYYIVDIAANPCWWVRINMDQSGNITGMWGQDADGVKWVADTGNGNDSALD